MHQSVITRQCVAYLSQLVQANKDSIKGVPLLALCWGNPLVTGYFPKQRTSNAESASMLWHHHEPKWYMSRQQIIMILQWHHNGRNGVSNHQPHHCLLNPLFRRRSKKTSKLHITGLCAGNSPVTGEFPAQMASDAENVSIWWRHHDLWI